MAADSRRVEPWPIALGALLACMIGGCIAFWWIAATHPDPLVTPDRGALLAPDETAARP